MIYEMLSGINPFKVRNKNKFEKLHMILEDEIEMQPTFSETSSSLIKGLLEKKVLILNYLTNIQPKKRLGYNGTSEIKNHQFFSNINWASLEKK